MATGDPAPADPALPDPARRLWLRALLGLVIGAGWFAGPGPALQQAIHDSATGRDPAASPQELRARLARLPPSLALAAPERDQLAPLLDQMDRAWTLESQWGARAAALLDADQRQRAAQLPADDPPRHQTGSAVDPALLGLTLALLDRYGYGEAAIPDPPAEDPWGALPAPDRLRRLYALLTADALTPAQGRALIQLCLLQIQSQERRGAAEERLLALLSPARRDALRAGQGPGSGQGPPVGIEPPQRQPQP